ncbi:small subunit ribosomal protein S4 [Micromonospora pattaloongensis]|uniref:Small ribosomal subunit protein uS4 n=1 Tax=Micromonospora pattaloongensis TaxID=405436 RepID=A0A1H3RTF2_9ACTN|nr:30S ribosomal protein S4 [Micromonospora pattaloongensis]SDZ28880.1 small subunit ribosomal protein S4 [Micromonospora pattaloongensis]
MASHSRLRLSRLLGVQLRRKCTWYLHRRQGPPGVRRRLRRNPPAPRLRLRDHRLLRDQYDVRGRQLGRVLADAAQRGGQLADRVADQLEQRLDALVWRAGLAPTVRVARQLISHNSFTVDGTKIARPSFLVRPGQIVAVRRARRHKRPFTLALRLLSGRTVPPPYLEVHPAELRAMLTRAPRHDEVPALRDLRLTPTAARR